MLRKVFTQGALVIAVSEVGSPDSQVTFPGATDYQFVTDAAVAVRVGDTFNGTGYTPTLPVVPAKVTMRQARRALFGAGLLGTVNTAIASMPGAAGEIARIDWDTSSEVMRTWPLVSTLGAALGLTSTQLDALFLKAEKL